MTSLVAWQAAGLLLAAGRLESARMFWGIAKVVNGWDGWSCLFMRLWDVCHGQEY